MVGKTILWRGALAAAVAPALLVAAVTAKVYRLTHPPRRHEVSETLAGAVVPGETVRFRASDGVLLSGRFIEGRPGMPPVLLCHEHGKDATSLLDMAALLQGAGFHVLTFDFRAHGHSEGDRSTMGVAEKRDVIGAVDYLEARGGSGPVGVYGVGMGAYAAVLAAGDRRTIRVLVLDGLYPDFRSVLRRRVFGDASLAERHVGFVADVAFSALNMGALDPGRAADVLPGLVGRHVLLIAPAGDTRLADAMEAMYASIPEQREADGNLVVLPATRVDSVGGRSLTHYEERVLEFLRRRLGGV